jgi:hypothetical protein
MHLQRPTLPPDSGVTCGIGASGREQLVLKMMGLEADVVLKDLRAATKAREKWGSMVWYIEGIAQQEYLRRVLDICMDTNTEAIEFVYSYYTGPSADDIKENKSLRPAGTYRLDSISAGDTDTKVNRDTCGMIRMKVGQIRFETDCRYDYSSHAFTCNRILMLPGLNARQASIQAGYLA